MKLTKPWKEVYLNTTHRAKFGNISLRCDYYLGSRKWEGTAVAYFGDRSYFRYCEEPRRSPKLAKRDAEKLAQELQQDIIGGARRILRKYGKGD